MKRILKALERAHFVSVQAELDRDCDLTPIDHEQAPDEQALPERPRERERVN